MQLEDARTCACFNLRAAARRVAKRYDDALAPSGLLASQLSILNVVLEKPGCGVADLAGFLEMDVSSVTRNLQPLVADGYVTVRKGAADARRREIRLTAKGSRALKKGSALWNQAQTRLVEELGADRYKELLSVLMVLR